MCPSVPVRVTRLQVVLYCFLFFLIICKCSKTVNIKQIQNTACLVLKNKTIFCPLRLLPWE